MPGLEGLPPSLLSIDTDGRVVHLESLSKWICPGAHTLPPYGPAKAVDHPSSLCTMISSIIQPTCMTYPLTST